jgi:RNA ligase (TIGR02306 family)
MSNFEVKVVQIDSVEKHPDADRLSIVKIGLYNCISAKLEDGSDRYKAGDLVVYIPEAAILPEWMLIKMDFWKPEDKKGTLAGSRGDRVKAIKLRGIVSQGILYPVVNNYIETPFALDISALSRANKLHEVALDQDVAEILGIVKYEPPVPQHMSGEVTSRSEYAFKYDIENLQKYNKVFEDREEVVVTEKRHGTFCCLAYVPGMKHPELLDGDFFASSKGMLAKGLFMKNNDVNKDNLYHRFLLSRNTKDDVPIPVILQKISQYFNSYVVYMFGEIFGRGIQDLTYFTEKPKFEVFDIWVGMPSDGRFLNDDELEYVLRNVANVKRVPVLYRGPFSMEKMIELRDGRAEKDGKQIDQIKEGIVVRSAKERDNKWIGRVQLKFISPNYLLRKGETTEFQ